MFNELLGQAKDSLKILRTIEKEAISRASTLLVNLPDSTQLRNQLRGQLKKLGLATQADVAELQSHVETLEQELAQLRTTTKTKKKSASASTATHTTPTAATETNGSLTMDLGTSTKTAASPTEHVDSEPTESAAV